MSNVDHLWFIDSLTPQRPDYSYECLTGIGMDSRLLPAFRRVGIRYLTARNALVAVAWSAGITPRHNEPFHRLRIRVRRRLIEQGAKS